MNLKVFFDIVLPRDGPDGTDGHWVWVWGGFGGGPLAPPRENPTN